jgi:hypothetical protein
MLNCKFTIPNLKSDQMNDERHMGEIRFLNKNAIEVPTLSQ